MVGIGASAGGITALQSLFHALRSRPNLALVVIQHLGREWPSQLVQLVGRSSTLPVRQAVDGERPKRGHIYVAGPDDVLTPERAVLRTLCPRGRPHEAPCRPMRALGAVEYVTAICSLKVPCNRSSHLQHVRLGDIQPIHLHGPDIWCILTHLESFVLPVLRHRRCVFDWPI